MLYAVVMAGGSGTRFWPESRRTRPKQLLRLVGDQTLLQQTLARIEPVVAAEQTLVVTGADQADETRRQLPQVPSDNVVAEPCGRDTAPCVGLAATLIAERDPQGVMLLLPADHIIGPNEEFQRMVRAAAQLVERRPEALVTFGTRPTHPATGYGYIHRGQGDEPIEGVPVYQVREFREKPDHKTAEQYLASGEYYWNGGIFAWRADRIRALLAEFQPGIAAALDRLAAALGTSQYQSVLQREYPTMDRISIDYAVMERATGVWVLEAPYRWDDAGSWQALARLLPADGDGNTVTGTHCGIDTSGCIIRGQKDHLIATLGVRDLIVVQTPDATLVADRRDEEAVKELVNLLRERGYEQYL